MNINLHHLQLFYYVAKAKGISAAVKIIPYGIQQPAISQQMLQFEDEIGFKLFERRPFSLTPAGEKLFNYVIKFFDNIDNEVISIKENSGTRVRFGCPTVISTNYFPELIGLLQKAYPEVRPHISEIDGVQINNALLNREIDIAFSMSKLTKSKTVVNKKLVTIPMALVLHSEHCFVQKGFWPKSDFAKEKWIGIQEASGGNRELQEGLSQLGITPEYVVTTNSVEAAFKYIEMKIGIAVMVKPPQNLIGKRKITVLPLEDFFGNIDLKVAWHSDTKINNKLVEFIYKTAKSLAEKYVKK